MYIAVKYKTLLYNMFLELGENVASRYFAIQKVLVNLVIFAKKYRNLVEIHVVLNLKVGQY